MGCGSSGHVIGPGESATVNGKTSNAHHTNGSSTNNANGHHTKDDLPTVVLPDTPVKTKPPVAYEIPIEEFDGNKRPLSPPPHLQRLLKPATTDISLPDIKEKLAEAEQRRLTILQQRAASAQKRAQRMIKSLNETNSGESKLGKTVPTISPEPVVYEDKNI